MKKENSKKITTLGVVIFSFVALGICMATILIVDILIALLVLKTSLPESALPVGSVIGSSLGTIIGAYFLAHKSAMKGIYAAAISGGSIIAVKIAGNALMGMGGYLNWSGMIGILFVVVFALIGGAFGALSKH